MGIESIIKTVLEGSKDIPNKKPEKTGGSFNTPRPPWETRPKDSGTVTIPPGPWHERIPQKGDGRIGITKPPWVSKNDIDAPITKDGPSIDKISTKIENKKLLIKQNDSIQVEDTLIDKGDDTTKRSRDSHENSYSQEVIDSCASQEELDYYIENGYIEIEIEGKKVLVPKDLDLSRVDEDGKTNLERMKEGKPPLDKNGKPYNLHHIGQNKNGPFALIPEDDHRGMDSYLHDKSKSSEVDRSAFQTEKKVIYKELAKKIQEGEI